MWRGLAYIQHDNMYIGVLRSNHPQRPFHVFFHLTVDFRDEVVLFYHKSPEACMYKYICYWT